MTPRSFLISFCAAVSLAVASPAAQAADPSADSSIGDLTQNATIWSPELAGGQWGWVLNKYRIYQASYKIGGNTYFQLDTSESNNDPPNSEGVLWNPLTGGGRHFKGAEIDKFWKKYADKRLIIVIAENIKFLLSNGRYMLTSKYSQTDCENISFTEYKIFDEKDNFIKGFYIVHKFNGPRDTKYVICREAEDTEIGHTKIYFATDFRFLGELSDGTFAFGHTNIYDPANSKRLLIIRLDKNFKPHTTLGDHVFVVDAAAIDSKLKSSEFSTNDLEKYNTFVNAFLAAVPTAKVTEAP